MNHLVGTELLKNEKKEKRGKVKREIIIGSI